MKLAKTQFLPIFLNFIIFALLIAFLYLLISFLNNFTSEKILLQLRWGDILIGLTIYLKTSVDFAIFIGNLMHSNPGWKKRIAIEIGTSLGNALGTYVILAIWIFFKDVNILLGLMVFIASLVLLRMAEEGLEESTFNTTLLLNPLKRFNRIFGSFLNFVLPKKLTASKELAFLSLITFSFSVPFILGLDDFAGYVPLFNVINVFGFSIGVFAGHLMLTTALFISPSRTTSWVKNSFVALIGSLAFILLALWGLYETFRILFVH